MLDSLRRILALIRKEFLTILKDPKSRFVVVGVPMIQLIVFSYAVTFDLKNIRYAVYDEDSGAAAHELLAAFRAAPAFSEQAPIEHDAEIRPRLDAGELLMVLRVGPEFGRRLHTGQAADLQVIIDGRNSNTALIALNYVRAIATEYNRGIVQAQTGRDLPTQLVTRAWFNPNLESRWFIVPGIIGLLTLVVTLLTTALSVAREREQGTFDQLLVTPFHPLEILLGMAFPAIIIGFLEAAFTITITVFWFGVPLQGSLWTLALALFIFLLSSVGVGLMISSLAATQQQGLLGAFLFMVPAVILSGFATPIANMPELVQDLTLINPLRYFLIVIRGVFLEGMPLSTLAGELWRMALIGIVCLALAGWLFRHRLY
jgi:ABC-2 type transport system permease protein